MQHDPGACKHVRMANGHHSSYFVHIGTFENLTATSAVIMVFSGLRRSVLPK